MARGTKRSGNGSHGYKPRANLNTNPKRGAPGILLTCETGREHKACREAMAILQQDWEQHFAVQESPSVEQASVAKSGGESLDKELEKLRQRRSVPPSFSVYETGCKGTTFILCTASRLIVPPRPKSDEGDDPAPTKKPKLETDGEPISAAPTGTTGTTVSQGDDEPKGSADVSTGSDNLDAPLVTWNPFEVMQRVVHDMQSGDNKLTSSRFITRMIPIQVSCYSSLEDIQHAVLQLLQPIVAMIACSKATDKTSDGKSMPKATTFAIQEKRRFCGHLKHDQIVEAVGTVVEKCTGGWKVDLSNPDYTVWIEVCKNVAGISVVPALHLKPKNFNLAELRDSLSSAAEPDSEATASAEQKTDTT